MQRNVEGEDNVMITVEKMTKTETEHFSIVKLESRDFDLLIVQLSNMSLGAIMKSELKFTKKYSGRILIDTILHSGNNSSRFVSFDVESGIIITDSREKVLLDRRNEIRAKSNDLLRSKPNLISYSIISTPQKKIIIKRFINIMREFMVIKNAL